MLHGGPDHGLWQRFAVFCGVGRKFSFIRYPSQWTGTGQQCYSFMQMVGLDIDVDTDGLTFLQYLGGRC